MGVGWRGVGERGRVGRGMEVWEGVVKLGGWGGVERTRTIIKKLVLGSGCILILTSPAVSSTTVSSNILVSPSRVVSNLTWNGTLSSPSLTIPLKRMLTWMDPVPISTLRTAVPTPASPSRNPEIYSDIVQGDA